MTTSPNGTPPAQSTARQRVSFLLQLGLILLVALHVAITVSSYLANQFFTQDVGHIDYWFYNTYHGRFFWSVVYDAPHFSKHFTPTLVLLVPFHALFHHVLFIPILEDLAILSGAWGVAWMVDGLVRRGRSRALPTALRTLSPLGLAAGWLYAANPHVGSVLLAHHFESFALALGVWALAALANRRWWLFWVLVVLALGVKEDLALYWGAFGAWWMLFGWSRTKWSRSRDHKRSALRARIMAGIALILLCVAWSAVAMLVIRHTALASGQTTAEYAPRYDWLGKTMPERLHKVLSKPSYIGVPLRNSAMLLLPSALLLPVLAPAALLLLVPPTYLMGLSNVDSQYALYYYYSYPFVPFLFLGVAAGLARLTRWSRRRLRRFRVAKQYRADRAAAVALVAALAVAACVLLPQPTRTDHKRRWIAYPEPRQTWIRMILRERIPANASVAAPFDLFCQVPYRVNIYPLSETNLDRAEYWIFDTKGFLGDIRAARFRAMLDRAAKLVESGKAEIVVNSEGLIIVRRNAL